MTHTFSSTALAQNTAALRDAAAGGRLDEVLDLLDRTDVHALDLNGRDEQGCTALLLASSEGHLTVVEALIDAGASVTMAAVDGETALHAAARMGHDLVVQRLAQAGADVNARDEDGSTPLHIAAWNAQAPTIERLLGLGARADARDHDGDTPVAVATMREVTIRGSDRPRSIALLDAALNATPGSDEARALKVVAAEPFEKPSAPRPRR